jgi:Zn finger protein HypA/HybF involved in hydrogenase expression
MELMLLQPAPRPRTRPVEMGLVTASCPADGFDWHVLATRTPRRRADARVRDREGAASTRRPASTGWISTSIRNCSTCAQRRQPGVPRGPARVLREARAGFRLRSRGDARAPARPRRSRFAAEAGMHEYSIVQALYDSVVAQAAARGARAVHGVHVRIGELSGVDAGLLDTAWRTFRVARSARTRDGVEIVPARWAVRRAAPACRAAACCAARLRRRGPAAAGRRNRAESHRDGGAVMCDGAGYDWCRRPARILSDNERRRRTTGTISSTGPARDQRHGIAGRGKTAVLEATRALLAGRRLMARSPGDLATLTTPGGCRRPASARSRSRPVRLPPRRRAWSMTRCTACRGAT